MGTLRIACGLNDGFEGTVMEGYDQCGDGRRRMGEGIRGGAQDEVTEEGDESEVTYNQVGKRAP